MQKTRLYLTQLIFIVCLSISTIALAQESRGPIVVNGDTVEYSADNKEITAVGNVMVTYKNTKLSCHKLTVNTQTKDAVAEGDVRIEDDRGLIQGVKATYNFQTKIGVIDEGDFKSNPYFGKAKKLEKISDAEFVTSGGYISTCSLNNPHYKIKSKKIDIFPGDKIITQGTGFYLKDVPLLYLPHYTHSLKDPTMHVQVMPGMKKAWGPYVLSAWRYSLTDNIQGRIYFDYRSKLGPAEGLGANYTVPNFGKGDFKYYYAHEDDQRQPAGSPSKFERYFIRWRHKWDIDPQTNLVTQYYKIVDSKRAVLGSNHDILKDYFPREYDRDSQPPTYLVFHHAFSYSGIDFILQKRANRWYDPGYLEKLPEIKYSLPSLGIGDSPFYFENISSAGNYNKKNTSTSTPSLNASNPDNHFNRIDTTNKFSLPAKVAFVRFTPFVASRQTYYSEDKNGESLNPRTVFYTGADASSKFYRIFNVKSNFLGMDINGLRHIITPSAGYSYNHKPTISSQRLKQIDPVDAIAVNNSVELALSNKLQTKRKGQSVDFLDFRVTTDYVFYSRDPQTDGKNHGSFSDFLFKIKLLPYAWMRFDLNAIYKPKGDYFSEVNPSLSFDFGKERRLVLSHRYQRNGGKELSFNSLWRINPKWKFGVYARYQIAQIAGTSHGLVAQQYTISRDLHCWDMDFTYSMEKNNGSSVWLIFRLKAFPELEFNFNQSVSSPSSGSQSSP